MAFVRSGGLRFLLWLVGFAGLAAVGAGFAFYWTFVRDLPELHRIEDYVPALSSHVLDREGRPIGEFFSERRRLTPLDAIPRHVTLAFVAGEDSSFYQHSGIDYESILRAAWVNLRAGGEIKQGGSTITQQMVKGLLLSPERKLRRKIREMILARQIEQRFSKDEILYLYLNQIYFGHGAYGIGEAARTYFGKPVSELSVSEGAMLAGLPKAPSRYSPFANPVEAEARRRYVLDRMLEDGHLTPAEHAAAVEDVPVLAKADDEDAEVAAYVTEEVRRYLFDELGSDLVLRGGLEIETTIDLDLQRAAVTAVRRGLVDLDRRQGYRGPLRRVAPEQIEAELARLAEENGLEVEDEEASEGPGARPEGTLVGVVLDVDVEGGRARVGFAPGVEGTVRLEDVRWARTPDSEKLPRKVRSIDKVFAVGDVAHFTPFPPMPPDESAGDGAPADETLYVGLQQEPQVQGALLSLDVSSGEVLAMVGGYDFGESQFNRATQARRQPGSSFKPIIYGAAIAKGYTLASIVFDRPAVYVDETSGFVWRPRNYKRSFYGPITLREALARSVNNATVHLFRDVGVDFVIDYARRLGITSPLNRDLSLALGSSDVSLLELTRAYAVFPAGGRRIVPTFIRRVVDREGNVLVENAVLGDEPPPPPEPSGEDDAFLPAVSEGSGDASFGDMVASYDPDQVIPPEQAYLMTDLLRAVVTDPDGTGWRLRALRRPVAGKTGTTNDQGDAWFMGFSPEIVTGVWVGHDDTHFLGAGETGSRAAAPIWVDFMRRALEERPVRDFSVPEPIVFARIDRHTGLLAEANSKNSVFQAFLTGTEPTERDRTVRTTAERRRLLRLDSF